jgi:hypothetical protein
MPQNQYGVVLSHYKAEQILLGENLMEEISEISDETKFSTTAISQKK